MRPATGKNILHVIETLDPAAGGPSESVRGLFSFAPPGYAGEVVTLDAPDAPFLKAYPFTIHGLGHGSTKIGYSGALNHWLAANRGRFDGVIVHGIWRYVSFAAWRNLHGRKPYVVFTHGMLDPYFKKRHPLKHLGKWVYWLLSEYWVLRHADHVLFTTEEEAHLAQQSFWLHRWRGMVVPFGADRPPREGSALREAFLSAHPHMRDRRFMLFLGRIHTKKGCDMLIESFIRLAASDAELNLMMAGPDQQGWSAELKQHISNAGIASRVHWPGLLKGDVKWGAFYASEVFILPSHQENFGIAVAEALACGRPVLLANKVNIAPEIARDGAGLMEADTQDGTDRLLRAWIAMPPAQRKRMSLAAQKCFDRRYDMRKNAATILRLFEQAPPDNLPADQPASR